MEITTQEQLSGRLRQSHGIKRISHNANSKHSERNSAFGSTSLEFPQNHDAKSVKHRVYKIQGQGQESAASLQATGMPPGDYYHDRFAACGSQANCSTYHHTNSL